MNVFRYLILLAFLTTSLFSKLEKETIVGITLYENAKDPVSLRKIKRLTVDVFKELEKKNYTDIKLVFLDDKKTIFKEFKSFKKFNMLVTYTSFYLENKDKLKATSQKPFIFTKDKKRKVQLVLIANKKSNIKSIKDLKNKTYISYINSSISNIWLDYLIRKTHSKAYKKIIKKELNTKKSSTRVLDVYFGKTDFTVVAKDVYDDMLYLNPSLKKNLVVVKESKQIFYNMIGLIHKNVNDKILANYNGFIDKESGNRKLIEMFKIVEIFNVYDSSFDELKELEDFYDNYLKLVKKTGG